MQNNGRMRSGEQKEVEKPHFPGSVLYTSTPTLSRKACLPFKILVFLISTQILYSVFWPQESWTQEFTNRGLSELREQLNQMMEQRLKPMDNEIRVLERRFNAVAKEVERLKMEQTQSKGFWDRITGGEWRRSRKLGQLYAESRDLDSRIRELRSSRSSLVREFITLADEFIEKSSSLMTALVERLRNPDVISDDQMWEETLRQLSDLWLFVEETREVRSEYAPNTYRPEQKIVLPTSLSDDPEELQLWAAALKDAETNARNRVAQLEMEIRDLEREYLQLEQLRELWKDIQRRDEEMGATGAGRSPGFMSRGGDEATRRRIEEIKKDIEERSMEKKQYEEEAERFRQQAAQIAAKLKGTSEDD